MLKQSVSVVIPMINENKSIEKVIDSVISSLENSSLVQEKEVIVVGRDALSEQTEKLRANYHDVQIFIANSHAPYPEVANKGLYKASGNIIVLLSEDTILPKDYFDVVIPQFEKNNMFAAGVVARYPATGESTHCYVPIMTPRHVNYKVDEMATAASCYTLTFDRSNVALSRDKLLQLGGFNLLFAPDCSGDIDLFLRGWLLCWKSCFLTSTHCDLLKPVENPLLRGETSKSKVEKEYNDVLLRRFFLPGRQQLLLFLHNLLLFIMSLILPLDIFKPTRMAGFKFISNFKKILSSKRWRYSSFEIDLQMLKQRYF